ncbi:LacI family transcriptional regulator [Sphingomonas sp. LB-2]|uniref:LacI family DNA-binding transcriptional regulator n=1 Tax=Sphingomonas caeni TaxID=2984949 RepID=UPI002231953A|nr:LacI family DNA-binding transcriptional regulator [Sphingomonas caeni]MCW3849426.1 LacI family transcriptional regulator [Sphingomonas caeni]
MRSATPDRDRSPATIRDIADRAGVSRMTVSRAINAPHRVSAETLARVEAAIAETGYRPDPAARQLALGGDGDARIALVYPEAEEARLGTYLTACIAGARQSGMQLVPFAVGAGRSEREAMRLERLDPQALILLRGAGASLVRDALPACAIAAEPEGLAAVCTDETAAAYDLAQRLIFLGHKRIGFMGALSDSLTDRARFEGYARALTNFGLGVAPELVVDAERSAIEAATRLAGRADAASAILVCREDQAAACLAATHLRGRSVPEDVAVCYFDDYGIGDGIWPELTRAALPVAEMCRAAFRLLAERIECARTGRPAPPIRRILFPRAVSGSIGRAKRRDAQPGSLRRVGL